MSPANFDLPRARRLPGGTAWFLGAWLAAASVATAAPPSIPAAGNPRPAAASASASADTLPPPAPRSASPGCGRVAAPGRLQGLTATDGEGRERRYDVVVTPGYDPRRPTPVVFVFHGANGGSDNAYNVGFQTAIEAAGDTALVVLPQGIPYRDEGVGWDLACRGRDIAFFDAMLEQVAARYCVDRTRVHASGFSWGADMTNALACCRGGTLRGVAPMSGGWPNDSAVCPSPRAPAAWIRYGTSRGEGGDGAYSRAQFRATVDVYRERLACRPRQDTTPAGGVCRSYAGCLQPLTECADPALGHDGPGLPQASDAWQFWRRLR